MSKTKRNVTGIAIITILSCIAAYSAKRVASKRKAEKARLEAIRPITGTQSPNPRLGARVPSEIPPAGCSSPDTSNSAYTYRRAMLLPLDKKIELLNVLNPATPYASMGGVLYSHEQEERRVQHQLEQLMLAYARLHGKESLGRIVKGIFDQHTAQQRQVAARLPHAAIDPFEAAALWRSVNNPFGH